MTKKVYCKDCKHYMPPKGKNNIVMASCNILFNEYLETSLGSIRIHKTCEETNKNNDCSHYEDRT